MGGLSTIRRARSTNTMVGTRERERLLFGLVLGGICSGMLALNAAIR